MLREWLQRGIADLMKDTLSLLEDGYNLVNPGEIISKHAAMDPEQATTHHSSLVS